MRNKDVRCPKTIPLGKGHSKPRMWGSQLSAPGQLPDLNIFLVSVAVLSVGGRGAERRGRSDSHT